MYHGVRLCLVVVRVFLQVSGVVRWYFVTFSGVCCFFVLFRVGCWYYVVLPESRIVGVAFGDV